MCWLPKPLHHLKLVIIPTLGNYPGFLHGCIDLVPTSLILLPMGSSLSVCIGLSLLLMTNGCCEYHTGYNWQRTFFYAHIKLWLAILLYFLCYVNIQLRTHPLQLTHGLYDSKLTCSSFSELILYDWHINTINISWTRYGNTHHP